jgi:hypothetical protein
MSCGAIVDFSGGKVGFVRMVFRAGILQNSRIEKVLGAICPAKVFPSGKEKELKKNCTIIWRFE